jgi:DNA-binding NarL/FixJ family response regulator
MESLRRMRSVSPPPEVITVTMLEAPHYLRELTALEASACLLKSASVEHLIARHPRRRRRSRG